MGSEIDTNQAETQDESTTESAGSKYVIDTGPGYQGIISVTAAGNARLPTAQTALSDWELGTPVYAVPHPDGIALVRDRRDDEDPIGTFAVRDSKTTGTTHTVEITVGTAKHIGAGSGDDLRLYNLADHTDESRRGLLLVDADDDPVRERSR